MEGLECEVHVAGIYLKYVSEFKYLGCVLDKAGTDGADWEWVAGVIKSIVNARDLLLEYTSLA